MSFLRLPALPLCIGLSASCMTSYDAYGQPMQTVDPGVAIAGVAAAALVGYALSSDNNNTYSSGYGSSYYGSGSSYYGGGYSGGYPGGYSGGYSDCYY